MIAGRVQMRETSIRMAFPAKNYHPASKFMLTFNATKEASQTYLTGRKADSLKIALLQASFIEQFLYNSSVFQDVRLNVLLYGIIPNFMG